MLQTILLIGCGLALLSVMYNFLVPPKLLPPANRAVLVTGCDFGFGNLLAKRLGELGYQVFAGCYSEKSLDVLAKEKNIHPILLDVTNDDHVAEARKNIEAVLKHTGGELWALVNNAGVRSGFLFDITTMEQWKNTMDVNYFGIIRTVKAFMPLLRKSKGRIINITSTSAATILPGCGAYQCSKAAAFALSRTLTWEMKRFGVAVATVLPGAHGTPMTQNLSLDLKKSLEAVDEDTKEIYGPKFENWIEGTAVPFLDKISKSTEDAQKCIDRLVQLAVGEPTPPTVNWIGTDANTFWWFMHACVPARVFDIVFETAFGFLLPMG